MADGGDPAEIAKARGFEAMAAGALESVVDQLIAEHPSEWERLKGGDGKMKGFFVGKVMAATNKQANGKEVNALLDQRAGQ
jgi:aspartyl-tRNA(Asn)/glutamyl-tRNA(Gln) amidotransferase subunit B